LNDDNFDNVIEDWAEEVLADRIATFIVRAHIKNNPIITKEHIDLSLAIVLSAVFHLLDYYSMGVLIKSTPSQTYGHPPCFLRLALCNINRIYWEPQVKHSKFEPFATIAFLFDYLIDDLFVKEFMNNNDNFMKKLTDWRNSNPKEAVSTALNNILLRMMKKDELWAVFDDSKWYSLW
jgi:hypothetical protein